MTFSRTLDGRRCIVDYSHPTPYRRAIYARALVDLANDGPLT